MITSLGDRESRIKGIENGADDFISKPFDATELKLKIKNFLKMKSLYDKVEKSYRKIKALSEMKDSLTSFIVHDLRNPLMGIILYLDLLSMSKNLEIQSLKDIESAKQNAEKMNNMISNLLDTAKIENNEIVINSEDYELKEILSSSLKIIAPLLNEKTINLSNRTERTNARVKVQRDLIERIVQNLLSNAIKFTPEQGNISIETGIDDKSMFAVVSVSDSGIGIPNGYKEKIFDKFATVKTKNKPIHGSSGLGLAFCKLAVELHGGRIWVEDRKGGGSIFSFTLPLAD